ncbi:hypothetical protein [Mesorhizobium sp. B4-1-1]|uniref:hypothetical protein n=1 Tax=Mesorhizobium sp. B4-1-1 TaxID=2589890 RepID=UPI001129DB83|nr:hypothetical protein [Mesorhizobium sp. B4-1-1]
MKRHFRSEVQGDVLQPVQLSAADIHRGRRPKNEAALAHCLRTAAESEIIQYEYEVNINFSMAARSRWVDSRVVLDFEAPER